MHPINKALQLSRQAYDSPSVSYKSEKVKFDVIGDVLWIAFAGTDDFTDLQEDVYISKKTIHLGDSSIKVHSGFWNSWLQIRGKVVSRIRAVRPKFVRLTGHSKGGAMALCAYVDLPYHIHTNEWIDTRSFSPIVFGCPKVYASSSYSILRARLSPPKLYINQGDPVPDLPRGYMGFKHWGRKNVHSAPWWKRIYIIRTFTGGHLLSTYWDNWKE